MKFSTSKFLSKEGLLILLPSLLVVVAGFWIAAQFIKPAPPTEITIATGSVKGAYHRFAKLYASHLAKSGITLHLKPTAGSVENIRHLVTEGSDVDLALVQGGVAGSESVDSLVSLGRMFMEPVWVFYRGQTDLDRLTSLREKTVAIGPAGSGTQQLAVSLLKPNGVTSRTAKFETPWWR